MHGCATSDKQKIIRIGVDALRVRDGRVDIVRGTGIRKALFVVVIVVTRLRRNENEIHHRWITLAMMKNRLN